MNKPSKGSARSIRLVCISDTHELHREIDIPKGDILIHAGDFTFFSQRASKLADFDSWLGELPHHTKIVVPGNHDFLIEDGTAPPLRNATLLINRRVESHGLRIWGSPLTAFNSGAFGVSNAEQRQMLYAKIPADTDILITHGPPFGILDCDPEGSDHQGCPILLEVVKRLRPRLHVFGHVHAGYGSRTIGPTTFANVAMLTDDGDVERKPFQFVTSVDFN